MLERMKIHRHQSPDRGLRLLNRYPPHQAASFSFCLAIAVTRRNQKLSKAIPINRARARQPNSTVTRRARIDDNRLDMY